jgi:hypothetical protein
VRNAFSPSFGGEKGYTRHVIICSKGKKKKRLMDVVKKASPDPVDKLQVPNEGSVSTS